MWRVHQRHTLEPIENQLSSKYGQLTISPYIRRPSLTSDYNHLDSNNRNIRCINNTVYESNNQGARKLLINTTYDNTFGNTYDTYDDTYYNNGDTSYTEYPDNMYYNISPPGMFQDWYESYFL